MDKNKTVIFALTSSVDLAKEICKHIGTELGKSEVKHFADGEICGCWWKTNTSILNS